MHSYSVTLNLPSNAVGKQNDMTRTRRDEINIHSSDHSSRSVHLSTSVPKGEMPDSTTPFVDHQRYHPIDPEPGQTLAKSTYISGRIILLWPAKAPNEHKIRFAISAKYPVNVGNSAYVSDVLAGLDKWRITITLSPAASNLKSGQLAHEVVKAEYDALLPYLGAEVKISSEGLVVSQVNGKALELDGSGARTMWTEKRGTWTVFQGG